MATVRKHPSAKKARKRGPAGKRTPELDQELYDWLCKGDTLREFCREKKINPWTIYDWMKKDSELAARVKAARDLGYEQLAERCLKILFDRDKTDEQDVQRRKMQVWGVLQLLKVWDPSKYGDKRMIESKSEVNVNVSMTDDERARRVQELLDRAASRN